MTLHTTSSQALAVPGGGRRGAGGLAAFTRRYYFAFALLLAILLYVGASLALGQPIGLDKLAIFAPLAIVAMANTPAILAGGGGIDLSISPNMVLANVLFAAVFLPSGLNPWLSVLIVILISAAVGAVNGALAMYLRLSPVVVTLSVYFILIGVNQKLAPNPVSLSENPLRPLAAMWGPFPGALILVALPLIIWGIIVSTSWGRTFIAVGGNDAAAFSAGVNVNLVRIGGYALGGLFAGIAGISLTALISSADATSSASYTLIGVAAVALGGTSLLGGHGGLLGSLLGALCVFLIQSLISSLHLPSTVQKIAYGGLLLLSIVISAVLSNAKERA